MKRIRTDISPQRCRLKLTFKGNNYQQVMDILWADESYYYELVYQVVYDLNPRKSHENS